MSNNIDLYFILGLIKDISNSNSISQQDIKNAYRKLIPKHHPDKGGDPKIFELITHAYNVLSDEGLRSAYDKTQRLSNSIGDHYSMKQGYNDVRKQYVNQIFAPDEEQFKKENIRLNSSMGYNKEETIKIDQDNFNDRLANLEIIREQDKIELMGNNIFDESPILSEPSMKKFNTLFDKIYNDDKNNENDLPDPNTLNSSFNLLNNNLIESTPSLFLNKEMIESLEINNKYDVEQKMTESEINDRVKEYSALSNEIKKKK